MAGMRQRAWWPLLLVPLAAGPAWWAEGGCPNNCSRRGQCDDYVIGKRPPGYGICSCWSDRTGADCSQFTCPKGTAWADTAGGTDTAHGQVECSNMGTCNRATGKCACRAGWEGAACERLACPTGPTGTAACSGHGQCISMLQADTMIDEWQLNTTTSPYSSGGHWEASKIYGCVCDLGFGGYDCSEKLCESGMPWDTRIAVTMPEVARLYCQCTTCTSAGTFRLKFRGMRAAITADMTATQLAAALMALRSVRSTKLGGLIALDVITASISSGTAICSTSGTTTTINFNGEPGDVPALTVESVSLGTNSAATMLTQFVLTCSVTGTETGTFVLTGSRGVPATVAVSFFGSTGAVEAAVRSLPGLSDAKRVSVVFDSVRGTLCVGATPVTATVTIELAYGNYPIGIISNSLASPTTSTTTITLAAGDGATPSLECCGGGDCAGGQCSCADGRGYLAGYGQCAGLYVRQSPWNGQEKCPGVMLSPRNFNITTMPTNELHYYWSDDSAASQASFKTVYWNKASDPPTSSTAFSPAILTITNAIALDMGARQIYWGDDAKIYRNGLPRDLTSSTASLFATAAGTVQYMALDLRPDKRFAYWTAASGAAAGSVMRKSLDASTVHDLGAVMKLGTAALTVASPAGIAIDFNSDALYVLDRGAWADSTLDGRLIRCDLSTCDPSATPPSLSLPCTVLIDASGGTAASGIAGALREPQGLALDLASDRVWITDRDPNVAGSGVVIRASLIDISKFRDAAFISKYTTYTPTTVYEVTEVLRYSNITAGTKLQDPQSIIVDPRPVAAGKTAGIYFTDTTLGNVYHYDTATAAVTLVKDLWQPRALAIDFGQGPPEGIQYLDCSGHGTCGGYASNFKCTCSDGWSGASCSTATCPYGTAWFDEPREDGTAHYPAECSNMGTCNRATGQCVCRKGWEGAACERLSCPLGSPGGGAAPVPCGGHGRCMTMRELASARTNQYLDPASVTYGALPPSGKAWDADKIQGCLCDAPPYWGGAYKGPSYHNASDWTGFDCMQRTCPVGDNPNFSRGNAWPPVQQLSCQAVGTSNAAATFALSFRQATTVTLRADTATQADVAAALSALSTLGDVIVNPSSTALFCGTQASNTALTVTFRTELGTIPLLRVTPTTIEITVQQIDVTRSCSGPSQPCGRVPAQALECSGQGICDRSTGTCTCFPGWTSSDGFGGLGPRRDCGYYVGQAAARTKKK